MDYYAIGQRIRKHRKDRMLSQEELAERVGISTTHMSHIETANTKLSLQVLVDIARELNVTADELLSDMPEANDNVNFSRLASVMDSCSEKELRIIAEVIQATANALKKNRE